MHAGPTRDPGATPHQAPGPRVRLLEPDDPMFAWRERMLDLFDGMPRATRGYPVWA